MSTTAIVTGASQGIGAQIAEVLAAQPNYRLALVARNESKLAQVAQRCQELGADTHLFPCDLSVESQVIAMAEAVQSQLGTPDLLVNNAGTFVRDDLCAMDGASFQAVLDSNLTSAFLVTRAFIGAMRARKSGTIFFMGSVASVRAFPESGAYCVAKHALLGLARSFRVSTIGEGLRITTLLPGATQSPSWDKDDVGQQALMPAADIARALLDIYQLGESTVVEEMLLRPIGGDL